MSHGVILLIILGLIRMVHYAQRSHTSYYYGPDHSSAVMPHGAIIVTITGLIRVVQ